MDETPFDFADPIYDDFARRVCGRWRFRNVRFDSAVKVGSTELPAGDYKVTWTGSGDNAQVTLKQGKATATTTAQVLEVRRNNDAFATKDEDGSRVLTEIQFHDKTLVLHNAPSQVAGQ